MLEYVHAGEEGQSGVERQAGSLESALTEGSWQVKFRTALSCRADVEEIAILLSCGEQGKKHLSFHSLGRGPSSA